MPLYWDEDCMGGAAGGIVGLPADDCPLDGGLIRQAVAAGADPQRPIVVFRPAIDGGWLRVDKHPHAPEGVTWGGAPGRPGWDGRRVVPLPEESAATAATDYARVFPGHQVFVADTPATANSAGFATTGTLTAAP